MMEVGAQVQVRLWEPCPHSSFPPPATRPEEEAVTLFLTSEGGEGTGLEVQAPRTSMTSCGQTPPAPTPRLLVLSGTRVRSEGGVNRALFEIKSL